MGGALVLIIMAVMFFIMSVFFFKGKGEGLISGYNMLSGEAKKDYDKAKVCRATGIVCVLTGIVLSVLALLSFGIEKIGIPNVLMLPAAVIGMIIIVGAVGWSMTTGYKKNR